MIAYLKAISGPLEGSVFALGQRTLLGRCGDCDIQLTEKEVSRRHALILRSPNGTYWVGDLYSTNGSFLGEQRFDQHRLRPGDVLRMGKTALVFGEVARPAELGPSDESELLHLLSGPADAGTRGLPISLLQSFWHRQAGAFEGGDDVLDRTAAMKGLEAVPELRDVRALSVRHAQA